MEEPISFLHLARPLAPAASGMQPTTIPINVLIHPQVIFSMLDHALHRPIDQDRVIGTLLGHRSDDGSEIQIQNCYAVPHTETAEQVEVDMDYQKTMLAMHLKSNPREVLLGWYATSSELNTFSALIQNFYGQQGDGTAPFPAVHLTIRANDGSSPAVNTYISAPIGVTGDRVADSCSFIPVPHEIIYGESERSGLEGISASINAESGSSIIANDIEALESAVEELLTMIDKVGAYLSNILDEEIAPATSIGQFLLNALSLAPKVDPATVEREFNNHIQDVLAISYLTNVIRTQIDLSNRLVTAALTGTGGTEGSSGAENIVSKGNARTTNKSR